MKKDTYYFSHDANARNDVKCIKLRRELGIEGYGIFWILIEMLREQPEHKIPLSNIEDIAYDLHTSKEKIEAVVMRYDLFKVESETFFSARLLRAMEEYNTQRNKYIEAGRKGGQASVKHRLNIAQAIKGNKRKGNKRKLLGSGAGAPDQKTFKQWEREDFIKELEPFRERYPKDVLNSFFKYWSEKNTKGRMKLQLQKTWETNLRLDYWINNDFKKAS